MAAFLVDRLDRSRFKENLVPNVPFSLADTNTVWLVESGKLDLFLVAVLEGKPCGARHHVMRVEAGQAVFSVGPHSTSLELLASPSPNTSVLRLSWNQLRDPSIMNEPDQAVRMLEEWIDHFAAALSEGVAQGPLMNLENGKTLVLPEQSRSVVPREGVLWVEHRKGQSYFLGKAELPAVNGTYFFPVSKHGWLKAEPESEIYSIHSEGLLAMDAQLQSLQKFNQLAMLCLKAQLDSNMQREQMRLRARADADMGRLHASFLRLTAPLHGVGEFTENESASTNALLLACEAIGRRLRIDIKPPVDMVRGQSLHEPVAAIARASGMRVRNVALKGEWWKENGGPLLAFEDATKSPVALLPNPVRGYHLLNPADGSTVPVTREVAGKLKLFACVFYRPFPPIRLTAWDLLSFGVLGCGRELTAIILLGVAAGLMAVITPFATGIIFDNLIPSADRSQLLQMTAFLLMIALAASMFTFARGFAVLRLEGKLDASIQAAVWDRLLSLPVSFFRDYSSGDLAQRSLGITIIRQTLTGSTLTAILGGIFSTFSFLFLFYYSWKLALLATALVVIAFLVSVACGTLQVRRQRQVSRINGKISSLLSQFIAGIAKFRVSGTEGRAFAAWAREFSAKKELALSATRVSNTLTVFNSVFPLACYTCIFYCYPLLASSLTTGAFLAFMAAFTQFLTAALLLSSALVSTLSVVPVYERAKPIFEALPEATDAKAVIGQLTGAIEVSNVSFRYKSDMPFILRDLSLKIEPGQFAAIVGSSGSGKSTLFRMLLGFESPESGAIFYDGHELSGLDIQAVRQQMGVVLQSSRPINGSIYQNIVGSAPLTVEDAWEAARLAGMEEDIRRMPMGMHTHLSDGGGGISGGQRQRLMIARAIVKRPRILLFDEATSALDNNTQAIVSRSLESLQSTRVVIAHRLSTIMQADVIFVLDKGTVVQSGTYKQLITQTGLFRELAERQMT